MIRCRRPEEGQAVSFSKALEDPGRLAVVQTEAAWGCGGSA